MISARARAQPTPAQLKLLRARIGMVFQSYNLWPHMTVLENVIEAPLRVRKLPRKQAIDEAEALLSRVGLYEKRLTVSRTAFRRTTAAGGHRPRAGNETAADAV